MLFLKHLLHSDDVSKLKMRNVKNEYLLTNRSTKEILQNFRKLNLDFI